MIRSNGWTVGWRGGGRNLYGYVSEAVHCTIVHVSFDCWCRYQCWYCMSFDVSCLSVDNGFDLWVSLAQSDKRLSLPEPPRYQRIDWIWVNFALSDISLPIVSLPMIFCHKGGKRATGERKRKRGPEVESREWRNQIWSGGKESKTDRKSMSKVVEGGIYAYRPSN